MYYTTQLKKGLSVVLVCIVVFGSMSICAHAQERSVLNWIDMAADGFAGGDGTEESPYVIETAEQLAFFAKGVNTNTFSKRFFDLYAELGKDIELNDTTEWERWGTPGLTKELIEWTPIAMPKGIEDKNGWTGYGFFVHLNGNGHAISGLYINKPKEDNVGLFSEVTLDSSISNLIIKESYIQGRDYVGGIAGISNLAIIENCAVKAAVTGRSYIGGIVGKAEVSIGNCANLGSVAGSGSCIGGIVGYAEAIWMCCNKETSVITGQKSVGGIAGEAEIVSHCYNLGTVTGIGTADCVGGIAGIGLAQECYNAGGVTGKSNVAPVCSVFQNELMLKDFKSLLVETKLDSTFSGCMNCYYLDDDALYSSKANTANAVALTAAQMSTWYCYTNWDFEYIWTKPDSHHYPQFLKDVVASMRDEDDEVYTTTRDAVCAWKGDIANGFECGNGTLGSPYEIHTAAQLAYLAQEVNKGNSYAGEHFRLEKDIVLNNTEADDHWSAYAVDWMPIGQLYPSSNCFSGIFDGKGSDKEIHSIIGLKQTITDGGGLFGCITNGKVRNLNVRDSFMYVADNVGGICGITYNSEYDNCSFSGVAYANCKVGGIVGFAQNCTISNCRNEGNIVASAGGGGIAGDLHYGSLESCYNTGKMIGFSSMGGIAGEIVAANIERCYNSGYIYATECVGGIMGGNILTTEDEDSVGLVSVIQNCYNSGQIVCSFLCGGGIAGLAIDKSIINCYNSGFVRLHSEESYAIDLYSMLPKIGNKATMGCIAGLTAHCSIKNCFFLEDKECKKGVGTIRFLTRVSHMKPLTGDEMQDPGSFPESWLSQDGAWEFSGDSEESANEYLFPQLKGLPHQSGSVYAFDYVSSKNKDAGYVSAAPFVFSNDAKYFSMDDYKMDGIYAQLFDELIDAEGENRVSTRARVISNKIRSSLDGHCFGMAAVMALYMTGQIDMDTFQWRANAPFDFLSPKNSRTVESLINYFHLSQNLNMISEKTRYSLSTTPEQLQNELTPQLLQAFETNDCVLLRETSQMHTIHYVVAYNIGAITENGGTVGIWDPNTPQRVTTMNISQNSDGYKIVSGLGEGYSLSAVVPLETLGAACQKLKENVSWLNLHSVPSGKVKSSVDASAAVSAQGQSTDNSAFLITSYDRFVITDKSNKKTATVLNGVAVKDSASLAISDGDVISEDEGLPLYQFELPNGSASYTIIPQNCSGSRRHHTMLCSNKEHWFSIVEAEKPISIFFNPNNKTVTTSSGAGIDQTVLSGYEGAAISWNSVKVQGITDGISQTFNEDKGYSTFSSDSEADITVAVSDGINEAVADMRVGAKEKMKVFERPERKRTMAVTPAADNVHAQSSDGQTLGWTVFFVSGTDEYYKSESVAPGGTVALPEKEPSNPNGYEDYIFRGWYTVDGTPWDFNTPIRSNIRLIAKWDKIEIKPQSNATLIGRSVQMIVPDKESYDSITWHSFNSKTATIDSNTGMAKLNKRGTSTIVVTLTKNGVVYEAKYSLRVYDPIEYVFVSIGSFLKRLFRIS